MNLNCRIPKKPYDHWEQKILAGLLHLPNRRPSSGRDAHHLRNDSLRPEGIEESHACHGMIYLTDLFTTLFAQLACYAFEIADRQAEGQVL